MFISWCIDKLVHDQFYRTVSTSISINPWDPHTHLSTPVRNQTLTADIRKKNRRLHTKVGAIKHDANTCGRLQRRGFVRRNGEHKSTQRTEEEDMENKDESPTTMLSLSSGNHRIRMQTNHKEFGMKIYGTMDGWCQARNILNETIWRLLKSYTARQELVYLERGSLLRGSCVYITDRLDDRSESTSLSSCFV
jgi:hypothetical protein